VVSNLDIGLYPGRLAATRGISTAVKIVIRPLLVSGVAGMIIVAGPPLLLTNAAKKQNAY
jgi:hypothetical protein